jgi:hypothetical protein
MTLVEEDDDRASRCLYSKGKSDRPGSALHRTCRQLYQETLPILYGRATFYLNPRSNHHCSNCKSAQQWSLTLGALRAAPPVYAAFITTVTLWAAHDEDFNSGIHAGYFDARIDVDQYQKWFWPHAIALCNDLSKLFPRLKVVGLIPDDANKELFACMQRLLGYKHDRVAVATCESCGGPPRYEHNVTLAQTNHQTHHPAFAAFQRLQEYIGTAIPEKGLPAVLRVRHDFWPDKPHLTQWRYHEHVFNEFLKIMSRPPADLCTNQQIIRALGESDFAMIFPCGNPEETPVKRSASPLLGDLSIKDDDGTDSDVVFDTDPDDRADDEWVRNTESVCSLCANPNIAKEGWWKRGVGYART